MSRPLCIVLCALAGCSFELVEHADTVSPGETFPVDLHLRGGGDHTGSAMVCAGLPAGWQVTGASYTGSVDGDAAVSGMAVRHTAQESWFGDSDDVSWSCWQRAEVSAYTDASHGVLTLDVAVAPDATGRHTLLWTLGTSGTSGEYISARAASTVRVQAPGHPLDRLADTDATLVGVRTGATATGFVAVDADSTWTSDDGTVWSPRTPGLAGVDALTAGGGAVHALVAGAVWRYDAAWSLVGTPPGPAASSVVATDAGVIALASDGDAVTAHRYDGATWQVLTPPAGAEVDGLVAAEGHLAWLTWDRSARHAGVAVREAGAAQWSTVDAPPLAPSQAVYDRVGIAPDGSLMWARNRVGPEGGVVELWLGDASSSWTLAGQVPAGDGGEPSTPRWTASGWVVYDGWGSVLSVDVDGVVTRHGARKSTADASVLTAGRDVLLTVDGAPHGVAHFDALPAVPDTTFQPGRVGEPYEVALADYDGAQLGVLGLPAGLQCNGRVVAGVPEQAGVFALTVTAVDAWGRSVAAPAELVIDSVLPDADLPEDVDEEREPPGADIDDGLDADLVSSGCSHLPVSPGWGLLLGLVALRRRSRR